MANGPVYTDDTGRIRPAQGVFTINPDGSVVTIGGANQAATYVATGLAYPGYATPTDMLCLFGSATKTVAITSMNMGIVATAATMLDVYVVKRSTANTGGTLTNPPPLPNDSASASASAVVSLYTLPPTLGTAVGNMRINHAINGIAANANVVNYSLFPSGLSAPSQITLSSPIILRGVAQGLCMNFNSAALPAGFLATWLVEWIEY